MHRTNPVIAGTAVIGLTFGAMAVADSVATARHVEDGNATWGGCLPENTSIGRNSSALAYAKLIEPELGVPPLVDCGAGVEQPIYVDGEKIVGDPGLHQCDNPACRSAIACPGPVFNATSGQMPMARPGPMWSG